MRKPRVKCFLSYADVISKLCEVRGETLLLCPSGGFRTRNISRRKLCVTRYEGPFNAPVRNARGPLITWEEKRIDDGQESRVHLLEDKVLEKAFPSHFSRVHSAEKRVAAVKYK
ncbi:hypothetical protein NPIL_233641 [Nephila pilipes]|uniref:Uncharacterized protein n=1 Tax=Nephila pilipes TaxID=299642 RepID=A0A8X6PUB1_NEPPI|nr:hypothetical protein NPIL_233641 [Nephila pilipes]